MAFFEGMGRVSEYDELRLKVGETEMRAVHAEAMCDAYQAELLHLNADIKLLLDEIDAHLEGETKIGDAGFRRIKLAYAAREVEARAGRPEKKVIGREALPAMVAAARRAALDPASFESPDDIHAVYFRAMWDAAP